MQQKIEPWLIVEDTLSILEDCLVLCDNRLIKTPLEKNHILKLKSYYSPLFEIEFSESGSYFYATMHCLINYCDEASQLKSLNISEKFRHSLELIFNINLAAINSVPDNSPIVENSLQLVELWQLQGENDISRMLTKVLQQMRLDLSQTNTFHK